MNKFDRPYRYLPTHDQKKVLELFNLVENLDTSELLHYSLSNQIPFDVIYEDNGNSLIHIVIKMDKRKTNEISKLNVIKFLFQNGANPDTPNKMNQTPLHLACQYQLPIIVKYLLEINVNPNYTDNLGLYPFHYLFFGEIKPVVNTKVLDFVQPPKEGKVDFIDNQTIIDIKRELYNLIKKDESLKIIKDSIGELIKFTKPLEDKYGKVMELYNTLKDPSKVKSRDILDAIKLYNNQIYQKIRERFNNFKDLSELNIHKGSKPESWNPNGITDEDYFLIKNYDFKKQIKKDLLLLIDGIKSGYANYNEQLDTIKSDDDEKLHSLAIDEASSIIDFDNNFYLGGARNIYINEILNNNNICVDYTYLNQINYILKNYSSKINIDKIYELLIKKQEGLLKIATDDNDDPSKKIHEEHLENIKTLYKTNLKQLFKNKKNIEDTINIVYYNSNTDIYYNDLNNILKINDKKKQILYLLFKFDDIKLVNFANFFEKITENNKVDDIIKEMFKLFVININDPKSKEISEDDDYIALKDLINNFKKGDPVDNTFFEKDVIKAIGAGDGNERFKNINIDENNENDFNKDLGILTDSQYIKYDKKHIFILNLSIYIIFSYCAIYKINISDNIKKQILNYDKENIFYNKWYRKLFKDQKDIGLCIYGMYCDLDLFLYSSDNINKCIVPFRLLALIIGLKSNDLIQGVINMYKPHIIYQKNDNTKDNKKDNLIRSLLFFLNDNISNTNLNKFFDQTKNIDDDFYPINQKTETETFIKAFNNYLNDKKIDDFEIYKSKYQIKYNNFQNINILQELFLSIYKNLIDKPLIQNVNDLLYLFNDIKKNLESIKYISVLHFFKNDGKDTIEIIDEKIPSCYNISNKDNHFIISHLMGLYYLGNITKSKFNKKKLDEDIDMNGKFNYINEPGISLPDLYLLNNVYNFDDNFILSDIDSYNKSIIYKVNNLKNNINNELNNINYELDKLKSGKIKKYEKIFTEYYINIIKNSKIVDNLLEIIKNRNKDNFNLLRDNLNKINSLFYIYYFLKNKNDKKKDTDKLSYFNQYLFNENYDYEFNIVSTTKDKGTEIMKGGKPLYDFKNIYMGYRNKVETFDLLPNSLYNNLDEFYKYSLIDLIYNFLDNSPAIASLLKKIKKTLPNIYIKKYDLVVYNILSKLIEEIYKQELDVFIYNYVRKDAPDDKLVPNFKTKDMTIDLTTTEINDKLKNVINIYPIIRKIEENNKFILYQNDFSNTNRFKISNEFFIDEKIIKILLEYNSNIFNPNIEGITPIYSLLKLNNNKVINKLFELGEIYKINIKNYIGPQSIEFIKKECENNLNKFLNNYDVSKNPISYIFKNINGYLYDDIKLLITSNESFGNNVLSYLEESFSICSYITLQFLGKYLTSYNLEYDDSNSKEIFNLVNLINMNDIYLFNTIKQLSIPNDYKKFLAKQLRDEKQAEKDNYDKEKSKIDEKIKKYPSQQDSIKKTTNYADIETNINSLNNEIGKLNEFLKEQKNRNNIIINYNIEETVKKYEEYLKSNNNMIMNYIWQKIFETKLEKNHDLILINLINRQSICLSDTKNLKIINNGLKHISNLCENYFEKDKYTDDNDLLNFINELLIYLTKIIICNGIEQMMRKILFSYLSKSSIEVVFDTIDNKIEFILNTPNNDLNNKTLLNILFEDISIRLVQSSVNIFENKSKENLYSNETVRDILTEYFEHLKIYEIYLSESILNVFTSNVVTYFDTFISRTILLWLVNIENIFKFFINNYRSTDILLSLSEDEINPEIALANLIMKIKENYGKIIDIIKNFNYLSDFIWYIFPTDKISKLEPEPKSYIKKETIDKLFEDDNWINIHKEINKLTDDNLKKLFNIKDIDRIRFFIELFKNKSFKKDTIIWSDYITKLKRVFSL